MPLIMQADLIGDLEVPSTIKGYLSHELHYNFWINKNRQYIEYVNKKWQPTFWCLLCLLGASAKVPLELESCVGSFLDTYKTKTSMYIFERKYYLPVVHATTNWSYYAITEYSSSHIRNALVDFVLLSISKPGWLGGWGILYALKTLREKNMLLVVYFGDNVDELFEILQRKDVLDAIVITKQLKVYTISPITKGRCVNAAPTFLGWCGQVGPVLRESDSFEFPNCTIRVAAIDRAASVVETNFELEVQLVQIVSKKLKVPYSISRVKSENALSFQTDVEIGDCCILAGSSPAFYYLQDEQSMFVPTAAPIHPWLNIVHIYDLFVWTGILLSLISVALVWHKTCKVEMFESFMLTLAVLISSVPAEPKKGLLVYALWCLASLILVNSYVGLLISFTFKSLPGHQVGSFDEMHKLNWKVDLYAISVNTLEEISRNWHGESSLENEEDIKCTSKLINPKVGNFMSARVMSKYVSCSKSQTPYKFFTIKKYLQLSLLPESKYKKGFEKYLLQLAQSGVTQHLDLYSWKSPLPEIPDFQLISLEHLYFIFCVYFSGLALATLAFLVEVLQQLRKMVAFARGYCCIFGNSRRKLPFTK